MSSVTGPVVGRFAPSPTGRLHVGNLRTALAASLSARSQGGRFVVRFDDLDRINSGTDIAAAQLRDLQSIGVVGDGEAVFQSRRFEIYDEALRRLERLGLVYECFCTRKEISEAVSAPHGVPARYPGTCRDLTSSERKLRRRERRPALRLRSDGLSRTINDRLHGTVVAQVDDIVLKRNDGVPSYNLATVVDDALQGVTEIVRGGDLLAVTPSQIAVQELLGYPTPVYVHLPLVVGADGERLSKRHGAVTLGDLTDLGWNTSDVRSMLVESLGQKSDGSFDVDAVPRTPVVFDPGSGRIRRT